MIDEHKNLIDRVSELERLLKEQSKQLDALRNDLRAVRNRHNSAVIGHTAVKSRIART